MATVTPSKKRTTTSIRNTTRVTEPAKPKAEPAGNEKLMEALSSKDLVRFYVPRDPTNGRDEFFERSINGHIIRLKAGTVRELPLWLVEYIESRLDIQRLSDEEYARFTSDNGAKLY